MSQAVLFDLDGTLIDSIDDLTDAANAFLAEIGHGSVDRDWVALCVGKGAGILVQRLVTGSLDGRLPEAETARLVAGYNVWQARLTGRRTTLLPGARQALDRLRAAGIRTALVTNKQRPFTEMLLDKLGLRDCLDSVVCAGDGIAIKPDPAMVFRACEELGVRPADSAFVGDSVNDAQCARRAGMPCWLVSTGYREGMTGEELAAMPGVVAYLPGLLDVVAGILATDAKGQG